MPILYCVIFKCSEINKLKLMKSRMSSNCHEVFDSWSHRASMAVITVISGFDMKTRLMDHFPLYWPISLVWMQPKTKEALPAGSTVITAIATKRSWFSLLWSNFGLRHFSNSNSRVSFKLTCFYADKTMQWHCLHLSVLKTFSLKAAFCNFKYTLFLRSKDDFQLCTHRKKSYLTYG